MNDIAESAALQSQLDYYGARASEYDQWWLRDGRYDRGAELNSRWFSDSAAVREALCRFEPCGDVLELACGTGIWTDQLLPFATSITSVDGSSEMLAVAEARVQSRLASFVQADLFSWRPTRRYDTIFFGFWLSHIPPSRFERFWQTVSDALAPGGRVFFVDSRHEPTSTASDHRLPPPTETTLTRKLNDGSEYQIYKVFYDPSELAARLLSLGWTFDISQTAHYFIHGRGHRTNQGTAGQPPGLLCRPCFP